MNWTKVVPQMTNELNSFANKQLSAENLYKVAVARGVGPEVRPLVKRGAQRARKATREALRRRNLLA